MINVNFFEKEKTNILPYIVGGIFLLLLLVMGIYFYFSQMHYKQVIEVKNEWQNVHIEEVVLSRQINHLNQLDNQSRDVHETLRENQFPMNTVTEAIVTAIPDEANRIQSFQLMEPNQITLILENTEPTLGQTIVGDLEELSFVTGIQLLQVENQSDEDNQLRWELIVDINTEQLLEEDSK